ncbi:ankyrin repeat-containing protein 2 [Striga asiatica]|uniref:Ankyrin repeat-containing protein 2 n=1 Tax=Striga asiatica TaxID=4170 RepID=A0A5A7QY90_STRAF|nr:ankyrin repeat-containing protein 2 [Striga asiatica]
MKKGFDSAIPMSKDEKMSESFAEKRKVSPRAADKESAKKLAVPVLLDPSITSRFLEDPFICRFCDQLAENESLVQTAKQLLEALESSTTLENGSLNDAAVKHFTLVWKTWRNEYFRLAFNELIWERESVVITVIEELSNVVEDEDIGQRMCRMREHKPFKLILKATNPPATMIKGLLIIVIGYWSYKMLPGELDNIPEENIVDTVEEKADDDEDENVRWDRFEEELKWIEEHQSPIEVVDREPGIDDLAEDLKADPSLSEKALQCMAALNSFDPQDARTLYSVNQHYNLAYEVLDDSHFIHLLAERTKRHTEVRVELRKYAFEREKIQSKDALAVVYNIIKDPGFHLYAKRIEKNDVGGALRIFLSILIVYWSHNSVYEKLTEKFVEYAREQSALITYLRNARGNDKTSGEIRYSTRFAGDLEGLKAALHKLYDDRACTHIFNELKIRQYRSEIEARRLNYDVKLNTVVTDPIGSRRRRRSDGLWWTSRRCFEILDKCFLIVAEGLKFWAEDSRKLLLY